MNFEDIRKELAIILEVPVDSINQDSNLLQFDNWDSLSKVTLIAVIIEKTGGSLNIDAFDEVSTVGELRSLIESCATVQSA